MSRAHPGFQEIEREGTGSGSWHRRLTRSQQSNNHTMMGSTEDPKDGSAVAATVFLAVAVYGVCHTPYFLRT